MLGASTIIGWTPSEFWNASYTDLQDAMRAWNEAHGAKTLTRDDVAQSRAKMRAADERARKRTPKPVPPGAPSSDEPPTETRVERARRIRNDANRAAAGQHLSRHEGSEEGSDPR
jgi:hypothetical protein